MAEVPGWDGQHLAPEIILLVHQLRNARLVRAPAVSRACLVRILAPCQPPVGLVQVVPVVLIVGLVQVVPVVSIVGLVQVVPVVSIVGLVQVVPVAVARAVPRLPKVRVDPAVPGVPGVPVDPVDVVVLVRAPVAAVVPRELSVAPVASPRVVANPSEPSVKSLTTWTHPQWAVCAYPEEMGT